MNIKLFLRILSYYLARRYSFLPPLPVNLTISLLSECNSRCLTCNVWKKNYEILSLDEYIEVFQHIGRNILWVTFSGGEPFLREDLPDICLNFYNICRPLFINIPTNGILYDKIPLIVEKICRDCSDARITINISLDHWGEGHDKIRRIPGNFEKALNTYNLLKNLQLPNLTIGIHSVLSTYNINDFNFIYDKISSLNPDSYIFEIAEERAELDTIGMNISPDLEKYCRLVDFIKEHIDKDLFGQTSALTQSFRKVYYDLSREILINKKQIIPCYAGIASAHIMPDGEVWPCCVRGISFGNLRKAHYNFRRIWTNRDAKKIRKSIKNCQCYCPLANAAYTNILCSPYFMFKVFFNFLNLKMRKGFS